MTIPRNTITQASEAPSVQFASGRVQARLSPAAKFTSFVGFHSEVGRDADFDQALTNLHIPQIEIKHQRPGGAEIKAHWSFGEEIRLFPVTAGPIAPTIAGSMQRVAEMAAAGIGLRWQDGERSKLAVRGFVAVKVGDAWTAPILQVVQLSVRSKMTDRLLSALLDHLRVIEAADDLIDRAKHPELVGFHEVALPLVTGDEEEWGKGETASVTPLRGGHAVAADRAYIRTPGLWRPDALHEAAVAAWLAVQAWAAGYALGIEGDGNEPYS